MNERLAPIAVFAFNRPRHLTQCLDALARNPEASLSDLYIFCDGPKNEDQVPVVREVRDLAHKVQGFREVFVREEGVNQGLARSVIQGVGDVLRHHERIIVIEDDLLVSSTFLAFMNSGLDLYADEPRVASIHGFMYEVKEVLPQSFFLRGADCWGWATWRRSWRHFNPDGSALLRQLDANGSHSDFEFGGAFPFRQMLEDQTQGKVESWAIRWYASAYLANMLTLYPGRSLVQNMGLEGSGTHQGSRPAMRASLGRFDPPLMRIAVEESMAARKAIAEALSEEGQRPFDVLRRAWRVIRP